MSYVRLKHTLSAVALSALDQARVPLVAGAMAAYARRSETGGPVPVDALARDTAAPADDVRGVLTGTGLFVEDSAGIALASPYRVHAAYFRRQAARLVEALRLAARPSPSDAPPEVRFGAALFDAGLFFEAHEYWEDVWRAAAPPERAFYHGLVQAAAGCYHAEKGNVHGASVLLGKARAKLEAYVPRYLGVDVTALLSSLQTVRAREPVAGLTMLRRPAAASR